MIEINKKRVNRKITNLQRECDRNLIMLDKLKATAWPGIPSCIPQVRAKIWSLLSDYIPLDQEIKDDTLARKREEYINSITHYFGDQSLEATVPELHSKIEDMSAYEKNNFKQIKIDVLPRSKDNAAATSVGDS